MLDKFRQSRARYALAASSIALASFSAVSTVQTSAASQDSVSATSGSLTANSNVLPRPGSAGCDAVRNGNHAGLPNWEAQVLVEHVNPAFDYRMYVIQDNGDIPYKASKSSGNYPVGTKLYFDQFGGNQLGRHTGWDFTARVYSVNRETGEMSNDWIGYKVRQPSIYQTNCNGATSGTGLPSGVTTFRAPTRQENEPVNTEPSTSALHTAPTASKTETPSSSTKPAPTDTEAPRTTTEQPQATESTQPEPKITIAVGANSAGEAVIIKHDGVEKCYAPLEKGYSAHINGNTVSISNGTTTKKVDVNTCALS